MDGSHFVSWHFNFGNHHNVVLRCESHKFAHLILGVKTRTGVLHIVHRWALAAFGYKARIFLDFNAPCLVIDEVKMDGIVFVARHFNDHSFEFCKGNERAHGIDHQFAHTSARSIHNFHRFQCLGPSGEELFECGESIEDTSRGAAFDDDAFFVDH